MLSQASHELLSDLRYWLAIHQRSDIRGDQIAEPALAGIHVETVVVHDNRAIELRLEADRRRISC